MSKSGDQELVDASDHVQINFYYEEATLELFVDLAKNYTAQSKKYDKSLHFLLSLVCRSGTAMNGILTIPMLAPVSRYLHTLLKMIHVLLKSLESYSKKKSDLIIRKVVTERKKKDPKKNAAEGTKEADGTEGAERAEGAEGSQADDTQLPERTTQPDGETQSENHNGDASDDEEIHEKKRISRERRFMFQEFERV